mgnify:CR=1 FL=1
MFVKTEINDFETIADNAWGGAKDVCQEIIQQERESEAMCLIEEMFVESIPSDTEVNEFIWFTLGDLMNLWDDTEDDEDDTEDEEDNEEE